MSPFGSLLVVTNLYPGISFLGVVPSSVSVPGIVRPCESTNDVVTFSYTYSVSPFGSFLVSTTLYPGMFLGSFVPSSVVVPGIGLPFLSTCLVVTGS